MALLKHYKVSLVGMVMVMKQPDILIIIIYDLLMRFSGTYSTQTSPDTSFETGFIDLLNVHNIYIHSSNLGHYTSISVRGENTIIKTVPVSSSFGYLIMDSVVAPHDKIDVSRQLF